MSAIMDVGINSLTGINVLIRLFSSKFGRRYRANWLITKLSIYIIWDENGSINGTPNGHSGFSPEHDEDMTGSNILFIEDKFYF